ncbi:MAG: competence/damage-inducible protein A [Eubacteriales bacterium]|nr:competence/damage-inducible protein A [Eubacteriales bacterium]
MQVNNSPAAGGPSGAASAFAAKSYIETAMILATGDEVLSGITLDTNSHYLAQVLFGLGIKLVEVRQVGDSQKALVAAAKEGFDKVDLLISIGGLGPTEDDLTMVALADAAGLPVYRDEKVLQGIKDYFESKQRTCTPNNYKQADFPVGSHILANDHGTACGALAPFSWQGRTKYLALLPGPPFELRPMADNHLAPLLRAYVHTSYRDQIFRVFGLGESRVEYVLQPIIHRYGELKIATYASGGVVLVLLRELTLGPEPSETFLACAEEIRGLLGNFIFSEDDLSLAARVFELLKTRELTISFAESCTAGLLSGALGAIPGASEVFKGSIVSYSNEVKIRQLGVDPEILTKEGAVSEACCLAMLRGVKERLDTQIAVSITGIAGPGGGSEEKPVGTVWIGIAYQEVEKALCYRFSSDRAQVQRMSVLTALDLVRRMLLDLPLREDVPTDRQ